MVVDVAREEGRANVAAKNSVAISFGDSRTTGVKVRRHFFHGKNTDGAGQYIIEGAAEICCRNWRLKHYGCGLGERVDAGIGASGALRKSLFAGQLFNNGHQCPLDGGAIGLDLPSGEVVAVVSQREFEISGQARVPPTLFNVLKQH